MHIDNNLSTYSYKVILQLQCTQELAHIEIVGAMCLQLSENADPEEIKAAGFDSYFVDHGTGVYPCSASGVPFNAACLASKGDPITDL